MNSKAPESIAPPNSIDELFEFINEKCSPEDRILIYHGLQYVLDRVINNKEHGTDEIMMEKKRWAGDLLEAIMTLAKYISQTSFAEVTKMLIQALGITFTISIQGERFERIEEDSPFPIAGIYRNIEEQIRMAEAASISSRRYWFVDPNEPAMYISPGMRGRLFRTFDNEEPA